MILHNFLILPAQMANEDRRIFSLDTKRYQKNRLFIRQTNIIIDNEPTMNAKRYLI